MNARILRCLLLASIFAPSPSPAGFEDGNSLHGDCTSTREFGKHYKFGYIVGVADAYIARSNSADTICFPDGVTKGQVEDVVCSYLIQNPNERHFSAASLTVHALEVAFPCP